MEVNNNINNLVNDLAIQNDVSKSSNNNISTNAVQEISDTLSNSYSINSNISPKRSELSNNLSPLISDISNQQIELSKLNNQNNILNDIVKTSTQVVENPETLTPEVEESLNELMAKYESSKSSSIQSENENTNSTAYFDGMAGAKPLKLQDMINKAQELQVSNKEETKVITDNINNIKKEAIDTIKNESSTTTNKVTQNIDFGQNTSDFSASNINSIMGSVVQTQANAIPAQSQRLLS